MEAKTAKTIAMLIGAMVFGAFFITVAKDGHFLSGVVGGGLVGFVSSMMSLGILSPFMRKNQVSEMTHSQIQPNSMPAPLQEHQSKSHFVLANGQKMTPYQFGALFVTTSTPTADMLIDILFGTGKPGQALPLARPVLLDPMPARLYTIAMLVAASFIYPLKNLGVPDSVAQDIMFGITSELLKLQKPDGTFVNPEDVMKLNEVIGAFYDLIVEDLEKSEVVEVATAHIQPPKATQLLLSLIVSSYNNGGVEGEAAIAKLKQLGYYAQSYEAATKMIDEAPKASLRTWQNLNVAFKPV